MSLPSPHQEERARLFKEYDVRGSTTILTPEYTERIGQAFGTFLHEQGLKAPMVCVGYDGRLDSLSLAQALRTGLCSTGATVADVGLGSSPYLYWSEGALKAHAAIMVTGSHNPITDNGLKITLDGQPFYGPNLRLLYNLVERGGFYQTIPGKSTAHLLRQTYTQHILKTCSFPADQAKKRIIWDVGHSPVGLFLGDLLPHVPGEHICLHTTCDGRFPERSPDPTAPEALTKLQHAIRQHHADVGFAFDGDVDRLVVVDDQANVWIGDEVIYFLATFLKAKEVVVDVKSSPLLLEQLEQNGTVIHTSKTGHVHLKHAMEKRPTLTLGGEVSGHFFFKEHACHDDGLYAALRFLGCFPHDLSSLALWYASLPRRFSTPEIRLNCPSNLKETVISELKTHLLTHDIPFDDLDGIRVVQQKAWWLVRPSQTQDLLVFRLESLSKGQLNQLIEMIQDFLTPFNLVLPEIPCLTAFTAEKT